MSDEQSWQRAAREQEIGNQRWGVRLSFAAVIVGFATAVAAAIAAWQAVEAVSTAQDAVLRAAREQRVATGIDAMGGDAPAQRVAGFALLRRSASAELARVAATRQGEDSQEARLERRDAAALYLATFDALENYLGTWSQAQPESAAPQRGQASGQATTAASDGPPTLAEIADYRLPKDVYYALNELRALLDEDSERDARC